MPETTLQQKIFPWDGAFDATKHPLLISPKDIVDSNNIVYTTYSTKKKRPGVSSLFDFRIPGNSPFLGGIDFWRLGSQRVVVYNGLEIYSINPITGAVDNISTGISIPRYESINFKTFLGLLIICFGDGVTPPKKYTQSGSITDLHPTAPTAQFCQIWLNRLWMPDPTVPGRLLYTPAGSIDFTAMGSGSIDLDISDNDPDGITAIFPPLFQKLYVAKRFSLYEINFNLLDSGDLVFSESKISDGIGCISHNAVAASPTLIFFPSDQGIHYLTPSNKLSSVDSDEYSKEIQPKWVNDTNFQRSRFMNGMYDRKLKSYLLLYPTLGDEFSSNLWGYSLAVDKWYQWRDYSHSCLFQYVNPITKQLLTAVGSRAGDLGFIDDSVRLDYGKPIQITLQSGIIIPGGTPDDQFRFMHFAPVFVPQTTGSFTISYRINGQTIETLTFDMSDTSLGDNLGQAFELAKSVLGGLPQVICESRNIEGYGMFYDFLITHQGTDSGDDGFEILGLLLDIERLNKVIGRTVG